MRIKRWLVFLLTSLTLVAFCAHAHAQEEIEEFADNEPSDDQMRLNKSAVDAIVEEDYERAVKLLESSLEMGELNVTWLNLGRALQKMERCAEAKNAYLSAVSAPAVDTPSPRLVNGKVEQYLEEIEEDCQESKMEVMPEESDETEAASEEEKAVSSAEASEAKRPPASTNWAGWATTLSGGAILATGVTFFVLARQEHGVVTDALEATEEGRVGEISRREALDRRERGDLYDTVALSSTIAGAALTGLGIYLLASDDSETQIGLGADGHDWSVTLRTRF